jgi:hypothetical protein
MPNRFFVAGKNSVFQQPGAKPAGFWIGLWHGIILPITFVVSLFRPEVGIYEPNNNAGWYNFGFLIGATGTSVSISVSRSSGATF